MSRFIDYLCRPLPFLTTGKAMLLRMLMLPNFLFTSVEGMENLEASVCSPCIYAFNHNNVFESLFAPVLLIYLLGGRRVSFVIDWMFGRLPLIGWLMDQVAPVYVYHKKSIVPFLHRTRTREKRGRSLDQCIERLASGTSIGIFPEGTRNGDPHRLLKAKPGIGYIALDSGAQVIPVGIEFRASSRRKRVPIIGRMVLRFGHPMHFPVLTTKYRDAVANGKRDEKRFLADMVTDDVMLAISELCGKTYQNRSSYRGKFLQDNQSTEAICPS